MKLQISLEFVLVFAFVITVFITLFAIVAGRSSQLFNQQIFEQSQLLAQDIAQQINIAQGAGSGYTANVALQSGYSLDTYNITVLQDGEIIVSSKQSTQKSTAIAFSQAKDIIASNTLNASNLLVQNYLGVICLDIVCPSPSNHSSSISLSTQVVHVARLNGVSSYILTGSNSLPVGSNARSIFAWVYFAPNETLNLPYGIQGYGTNTNNALSQLYIEVVPSTNYLSFSDAANAVSSFLTLSPNNWYFVGYTYSAAASQVTLYLNGQSQTLSISTPMNTILSSSDPSDIGRYGGGVGTYYFPGDIADVQIYNTSLTSSQELNLYREGITGSPISSNVVGWWPLNGNPTDYSIHNNNGTVSSLLFPTAAQIAAKVTDGYGHPVNDTLVGFTTTNGTLSKYPFSVNFTNSNGLAYAFLTQNLSSGLGIVKAMAYTGGIGEEKNLSAWWPLNTGCGTNGYDISGNNNTGTMTGTQWVATGLNNSCISTKVVSGNVIPTNAVTSAIINGFSVPGGVAFSPSGTFAYVTNEGTNNVVIVNTGTQTVTGAINLGFNSPHRLAFSPTGAFAYIANQGSSNVVIISTATNAVVGAITTGIDQPIGVAFSPSGSYAYIANGGSGNVAIVNTATNTVTSTISNALFSEPGGIAFSPSGTYAYVTDEGNNKAFIINTATNTVTNTLATGFSSPDAVAFSPTGSFAYLTNAGSNNVVIINTATNTLFPTAIIGFNEPIGVAFSPSGSYAYVTNGGSSNVVVINEYPGATGSTSQINGYGVQFLGSGQITVPFSSSLNLLPQNNGITISMWMYPLSSSTGYALSTGSGGCGYFASTSNTNLLATDACGDGTGAPYTLNPNAWYGFGITANSGNSPAEDYYIDGMQVANVTSAKWTSASSWNTLCIGSSCGSNYLTGSLANIQIYKTPLSKVQMAQLYSSGISPTATVAITLGLSHYP